MNITALYVGVSAFFLIFFSVQVIRCRVKHKVVLLDGGVDGLARHCRAHANFTEYTPMMMLLLAVGEISGSSPYLLHTLGTTFLIGRALHFYSMTKREIVAAERGVMDISFRQAGMFLTFATLGVSALNALLIAFNI